MGLFKRPEFLYPTVVKGKIVGPIRCESIDGSIIWLPAGTHHIMSTGEYLVSKDGIARLEDFKTFVHEDGKTYFITHLQKKASYFSLLYSPFIYHYGWFWRLPKENAYGGFVPNSEQGIYWRTCGWRWQLPDARSEGTTWIWSGGRIIGSHQD